MYRFNFLWASMLSLAFAAPAFAQEKSITSDATINSEVWSTEAGQITQEGLFTPAVLGQVPVTLTINGVAKTLEIEVVAAPVTEDPAQ